MTNANVNSSLPGLLSKELLERREKAVPLLLKFIRRLTLMLTGNPAILLMKNMKTI